MEIQRQQCSQKPQKIVLFLTGFGKFGKILHNPTTVLSNSIEQMLQENPIDCVSLCKNYVITVAIQDCDEALEDIYNTINKMREEDIEQTVHYLVIHFGVYQGSGKFNLEHQGKNCKNFFIPDERGNQPKMETIDCENLIDHIECTKLDLEKIAGILSDKGFKVAKSHDAGNYICNYTYFQSLKQCQKKVTNSERVTTLFCHVPQFEEIDENTQKAFVLDLLNQIRCEILEQ